MEDRRSTESELRLKAILEMAADALLVIEPGGDILQASDSFCAMFGVSASSLSTCRFPDFVHPDDASLIQQQLDQLAAGTVGAVSRQVRFSRRDRSAFTGMLSVRIIKVPGEEAGQLVITVSDMTERLETDEAMKRIVGNYWEIFNATNDAIMVHDAYSGAIVEANRTVEKLFGYSREEIFVLTMHDFSAGESPYSLTEAVRYIRKAVECGPQSFEWLCQKKNGERFWAEFSLTSSHIGGEGRVLAVIRDITDRKEIEKRLKYLSAHDSLTGLYNRLHFETEFERICHGRIYPLSVIVADLDGLKSVNDTLGHTAGDELIIAAARVLKDSFRTEDIVARIGGDEFAVLLPDVDTQMAGVSIARIRETEMLHNLSDNAYKVSFSLGYATAASADDVDDILKLADARMYADKAARKSDAAVWQELEKSIENTWPSCMVTS